MCESSITLAAIARRVEFVRRSQTRILISQGFGGMRFEEAPTSKPLKTLGWGLEAGVGIEPTIGVLQTPALPLG